MESDRAAKARSEKPSGQTPPAVANAFGLTVSDLGEERRQQLRVRGGVLVDAVDGAAARAGLRPGDVILALDNQDVTSARQFNELVGKIDRAKTHVVLVRRGEVTTYVPIKPAPAAAPAR
jgi:serine protease Do